MVGLSEAFHHSVRKAVALAFALMCMLALGACAGEDGPSDETSGETFAPGETHVTASGHDLLRDTGDLERIRERGTLRVLVPSTEEAFLPRQGSPRSLDRELARAFADRNGLEIRFILVPDHDQLLPMLAEGQGDLVAAQLTVTENRSDRFTFTWPLFSADEVLVGPAGADGLPGSAEELDGHEVHVRAGSSYFETLQAIAEEAAPGLEIVPVPEHLDTETIVYEVSVGQRPLTVVDSHLLAEIETYNNNIQRLATLVEEREIAWALRSDNPALRSAVNAFLVENALHGDANEPFTGDLDGIRERGVLRVLTRNNPVTYFLHRGEPLGFDYTLARMLADALGVQLRMVVPPSRDELIPWLLEGRGDIIAASLTRTPEREERVAFSEPYLYVDEIVVGPVDGPDLAGVGALAGQEVHVRASSSYHQTLLDLDMDVNVVAAPESLETEELIDRVGRGEIPLTVADAHILQVELTYRDDIRPLFALTGQPGAEAPDADQVGIEGEKAIAFAVRPDADDLRAFLDGFVHETYRGVEFNMARRRYFEAPRTPRVDHQLSAAESDGEGLSQYDDLVRRYANRYGFDWRLMGALAYQESRFDPYAESWAGAVGLFQVMPRTGRALGFDDLTDPEASTHAGTLYLYRQAARFEPGLPFEERLRFALAGYNAGTGHVQDARRLAAREGLDPDVWFGNVEEAMLLLMRPEYHRQARHGYVRGTEPVDYVAQIQNRYENYAQMLRP